MMYAFPATEIRNKIAGILKKIRQEGATCLVTQRGRGTAVLLPIDVYNRMVSDLEDRMDENDPELAEQVAEGRKEYRAGNFKTLDQIPG